MEEGAPEETVSLAVAEHYVHCRWHAGHVDVAVLRAGGGEAWRRAGAAPPAGAEPATWWARCRAALGASASSPETTCRLAPDEEGGEDAKQLRWAWRDHGSSRVGFVKGLERLADGDAALAFGAALAALASERDGQRAEAAAARASAAELSAMLERAQEREAGHAEAARRAEQEQHVCFMLVLNKKKKEIERLRETLEVARIEADAAARAARAGARVGADDDDEDERDSQNTPSHGSVDGPAPDDDAASAPPPGLRGFAPVPPRPPPSRAAAPAHAMPPPKRRNVAASVVADDGPEDDTQTQCTMSTQGRARGGTKRKKDGLLSQAMSLLDYDD